MHQLHENLRFGVGGRHKRPNSDRGLDVSFLQHEDRGFDSTTWQQALPIIITPPLLHTMGTRNNQHIDEHFALLSAAF